jgi:hypothetical protein
MLQPCEGKFAQRRLQINVKTCKLSKDHMIRRQMSLLGFCGEQNAEIEKVPKSMAILQT